MWKKLLLAVLAVIAVFLLYAATRPADYRIERSTAIAAPPAIVYAQIADFHHWSAWSPWAHLDPHMSVQYSGTPNGPGAIYEWSGNEKVGQGRMTIVDAQPAAEVDIRLEFMRPWAQTSRTQFHLRPEAGGTRVAWVLSGKNDFVGKTFGVFVDRDKIVGGDFEKGLQSLRLVTERIAKATPAP